MQRLHSGEAEKVFFRFKVVCFFKGAQWIGK